ncbi:unnamed protein product, partial [Rotaria magnacalcarata]
INNDYTDEDEQNNTQDLINTTKKDFSGVKVADKVEPHIEHTYFKVKLNHDTKCVHKQTACWLLTEEKSKLSNDRLLRVQQVVYLIAETNIIEKQDRRNEYYRNGDRQYYRNRDRQYYRNRDRQYYRNRDRQYYRNRDRQYYRNRDRQY